MIKRILKIWFIIAMYELSKYITNELIVKLQSEDDIDTAPKDSLLERAINTILTIWQVGINLYSKEAIINMIGTHKMKCNVIADAMPDYDSNSIAQYGIQATLPKPQGQNSSKVEDVVIKLERTNKRYAQMLREIEFINQSQQKLGHVDFVF